MKTPPQLILAALVIATAAIVVTACDIGGDEPATPTPEPVPIATPTPTAPPEPTAVPTLAPDEAYLAFLRSIVTTLRAITPEAHDLLNAPRMDDGFWNIEIREMALGLSSIFDRLVGKDPPDDWVRYHLTLVSALGSTAENVELVVTSLNGLDFQTFTTALGVSVQAIERLQETLQEYETLDPGAVPPMRTPATPSDG
ncbi:MAG: hypothetical protein OXG33_09485 [Chloroflexi bacterium]|nr:hypothetical protein [Chloroflexota bacterium]